jgi:hypothetical protein
MLRRLLLSILSHQLYMVSSSAYRKIKPLTTKSSLEAYLKTSPNEASPVHSNVSVELAVHKSTEAPPSAIR